MIWSSLGINDGRDYTSKPDFDLVGDAGNSGFDWGQKSSYVFFRFGLDQATTTFVSGSFFVLIDAVGTGNDGIDFGFSWDGKSTDTSKHGLEMSIVDTSTTWSASKVNDIDGINGAKLSNDINGDGRTGDGYLRLVDNQPTANFGNITYVEIAVSLAYLHTYVPTLETNSTWKVAAASVANATDHSAYGDVMGVGDLGSAGNVAGSAAWSQDLYIDFSAIPEPRYPYLVALIILCILRRRRN